MNISSTEAWDFCDIISNYIEENFYGPELERFFKLDLLADWAESHYYRVFNNSGDLETYIIDNYVPESIFDHDALASWAKNNNFVER